MTLNLGNSQEARFRGSFPTSPAQMELPAQPRILEEPNRRVPASGPLPFPTCAHRRPCPLVFGSCQSGIKMVLGLVWACANLRAGNITSLVSCFSRHFHSGDALVLSTVLSCKRMGGLGTCQWTRPDPFKRGIAGRRCRSGASAAALRELGTSPHENPKTGPLSARLHSYTIRTSRDALDHTPRYLNAG